jgi:hypothetical protein
MYNFWDVHEFLDFHSSVVEISVLLGRGTSPVGDWCYQIMPRVSHKDLQDLKQEILNSFYQSWVGPESKHALYKNTAC